jgi:putative protease
MNTLELLAPAKNADIGREAILHGADAVYIGGPAFGARHNAGNSIADIAKLVGHAHKYNAQIFVTLNTMLHDAELEEARQLVVDCYEAGVDALIVQDMGLLELDLPPIALHASTQCDIRTPQKAKFLSDAGFSQIVLARELNLKEIAAIRAAVPCDTLIEHFIHGALCVAYSGQCYISHAHTGRSANRGDCSQACRLPYTLEDNKGRVVAFDKHLLSVKDNNQSNNLRALIDAGVRSFKIEGRYKDMSYVKNITGHYRRLFDEILNERPELVASSSGKTKLLFTPDPDKTFHRGATDYFTNGRRDDIGAFDAPSFVGTPLGNITAVGADWFDLETEETLANSDGLNYMNNREVIGLQANIVKCQSQGLWRIWPNEPMSQLAGLRKGIAVNRNRDHIWEHVLTKKSAERRIEISAHFSDSEDGFSLTLQDEDGVEATATIPCDKQAALHRDEAENALREQLARFGSSDFALKELDVNWSKPWFVPSSLANRLRRDAVEKLEAARQLAYARPARKTARDAIYPDEALTYLANVNNHSAHAFYTRHGVKLIESAYEAHEAKDEVSLMITRHCLRFSLSLCPKQAKGVIGVQGQVRADPMTLVNGSERLTLKFDCRACEMHVMGKIKIHILKSVPVMFHPRGAKR